MKLMKNPEVRKGLIIYIIADAGFIIAGFSIDYYAGLLAFGAGILFTFIYLISSYKRYQNMAELSQNIDRILHGQEQLLINESIEGELSVLRSEVQKMTIRLREQADSLKKDKVQMSDALADISHQLRTPLTSMNLTVSMLNSENITEERRIQLIHDLKRALSRIDWLIEALLKMSKIDAGTARFSSETVYVSELVRKICEPVLVPMELREQTLKVIAEDEKFTGDLHWSTEALGNVLKNCMEHTPVGGTIEIRANETAIFTEIIVKDNGTGFDSEDIPHLFERFYRGKNASSESVGIGLALARMVIAQQNGTIKAENNPEGGALFTVRFYKGVI